MEFIEHVKSERFPFWFGTLPYATLVEAIFDERDHCRLGGVGEIDGEVAVDVPEKEEISGIGIVGNRVRHGEIAFGVVGSLEDVVDVGADDGNRLSLS
jgi:hypothetical protein